MLVIGATAILCVGNASDSGGHTRFFWTLMAAGMVMWSFNQACWAWFELVLRKPLPDPFPGICAVYARCPDHGGHGHPSP